MPVRRDIGKYATQARSYDRTRGASPTLVRVLARFLGPPDDRALLDIGGGTGNYGQALRARGFRVVVLDTEPAMLALSVPKVGAGRQIVGDALAMPIADASVDCAMVVAALHLVGGRPSAMREARRVIRDGPFVLQDFTQENLEPSFVYEYFAGSRPPEHEHPPEGDILRDLSEAGFSRVAHERFVYLDTADANLQALHTDALRLAGSAYLRNTSFFQRLPEAVRLEGLARLAADLRSGRLEERVRASFQEAIRTGHGTVFAAWP
ncbi:MAG: methyltransferase domain-containing protein [Actinobacteria bacterium]|nr:methyltransferase domain-containing protein [Actinomycetota bacterium]